MTYLLKFKIIILPKTLQFIIMNIKIQMHKFTTVVSFLSLIITVYYTYSYINGQLKTNDFCPLRPSLNLSGGGECPPATPLYPPLESGTVCQMIYMHGECFVQIKQVYIIGINRCVEPLSSEQDKLPQNTVFHTMNPRYMNT